MRSKDPGKEKVVVDPVNLPNKAREKQNSTCVLVESQLIRERKVSKLLQRVKIQLKKRFKTIPVVLLAN